MEQFRWGDRRASRALRELRMAGLLEGESETETEAETETNAHPPMLPVTAASVVDVVGVVGCKNREQNGQEIQNASRDLVAGAPAGNEISKISLVMCTAWFSRLKSVCTCVRRLQPVFPGDFSYQIIFLTFITRVNSPDTGLDSNRDQGRAAEDARAAEDDRTACSSGPVRTLAGYVHLRAPPLGAGALFVVCGRE